MKFRPEPSASGAAVLSDYTLDARVLYLSALAALLGLVASIAAWALLELINLATNIFYYQRISFVEAEPYTHPLRWWSVFIPVVGGLIVGIIARYGSPRVRGHGLPEAIETVVFGGGRVQPRVAILKPLATAIAIGSGGPFGAEGPVIITGGAIGSVVSQLLPMTETERRILMVSGAAAGMAATFSCPMSAILLAVEILLFEWRPRSLIPVSIACVTAGAIRRLLLGAGPIFLMSPTVTPMHHTAMLGALCLGVLAALLATLLSKAIHFSEAAFDRLPIHWMWWPAIGGIGIGLGGLIFPQALGVGYTVIGQLVNDQNVTWKLLAGILVVKSLMWVFSLGSNTAGGLLAPLLMIGGAMGAAFGSVLPVISPGAWVVVGMTSTLAAAIGSPLTAAMLAVELTHNGGLMLPVLLACVTAYAISILIQPRSMLTESLSRRGLHLSREYGVDPLEMVLVASAMHTSVYALPADATNADAAAWLKQMNERGADAWSQWQRIFPIVDSQKNLVGVITRARMIVVAGDSDQSTFLRDEGEREPVTLSTAQTMRQAALVMADTKHTSFPVLDAAGKFAGILTISDLLTARSLEEEREQSRERVLRVRWPFGSNRNPVLEVDPAIAVQAADSQTDAPSLQTPAEIAKADEAVAPIARFGSGEIDDHGGVPAGKTEEEAENATHSSR